MVPSSGRSASIRTGSAIARTNLTVAAQAVSLGCYALLYRQVLARELWLVTAWRERPDGAPQPVSDP